MAKRGRPPFEITEDVLKTVEEGASRGLEKQQIARVLGISPQTFIEKRKKFPELVEALKRGEALGVSRVANALFLSATVERNVTAQIFYLKNRDPDRWKDRRHIDETHRFDRPEVDIDEQMSPQEAAAQYADTLRRGKSGNVVPMKRSKR